MARSEARRKCKYRNLQPGKTIYDGRIGALVDLQLEFYGVTKRHTTVALGCFFVVLIGSLRLLDLWRLNSFLSTIPSWIPTANKQGIVIQEGGGSTCAAIISFVISGQFVFLWRFFRRSFVFSWSTIWSSFGR
ncbi:hypothetical protein BZA77DRAFT_161195 [Pyronema omphalodes]|nr:hypothetical protein BZA77DRAFT_161195 [Pyronema omphalodes]